MFQRTHCKWACHYWLCKEFTNIQILFLPLFCREHSKNDCTSSFLIMYLFSFLLPPTVSLWQSHLQTEWVLSCFPQAVLSFLMNVLLCYRICSFLSKILTSFRTCQMSHLDVFLFCRLLPLPHFPFSLEEMKVSIMAVISTTSSVLF